MPFHALPGLRPDSQMKAPTAEGEWLANDTTGFLGVLADSLLIELDPVVAAKQDVFSTPDVWAQVVMFEADLFSSGTRTQSHARRLRAVGEWRGLLALLALKHFTKLELSGEWLDLSTLAQRSTPTLMNFGNVVHTLNPKSLLLDDLSWDELTTLRVSEKLVGIFNPATLVAPAREYAKALQGTVKWLDGDHLADPCAVDSGLTPRQYLALHTYLVELQKALFPDQVEPLPDQVEKQKTLLADQLEPQKTLSTNQGANDRVQELAKMLAQYIADCNQRASKENKADVLAPGSLNTISLPAEQHSLAPLLAAWRLREDLAPQFHTLMAMRPDLLATRDDRGREAPVNTTFRGLLLIDEKMNNRADVTIWGDDSLEDVLLSSQRRDEAEKAAAAKGYVFVDAKTLFTDRLYHIATGTGVSGHAGGTEQYILPLAPWLLLFLQADHIRSRISIDRAGNQSIVVTLRLDLERQDGNGVRTSYRHEVSRVYGKAEIERSEAPATLSMWPDFVSDDWRHYYAFYSGQLNRNFTVRGLVHGIGLRDSLLELWSRSNEDARAIKGWLSAPTLASRKGEIQKAGTDLQEIHFQSRPVEAIACDWVTDPGVTDYVPSTDRLPIGILLPPRVLVDSANSERAVRETLSRPVVSDTRWRIGIDFGSSNTILYCAKGENKPEVLQFDARTVNLLRDQKDWVEKHRLYMPGKRPPVPFMTILRSRLDTQMTDAIPLFRDHMYFIDNGAQQLETMRSQSKAFNFNLKWKTEPADRLRAHRFLRQAVLMASAEACASGVPADGIRWRFSYPEAFRQSEFEDLLLGYTSALRSVDPKVAEDALETRTESKAAAFYFHQELGAHLNETVVVLDVGGSTTDIAFWHNNKFVWRSSVKVAGGHILQPFLMQRTELVQQLAEDSEGLAALYQAWQAGENNAKPKESTPEVIAGRLNALDVIINQQVFSDALRHRLPIAGGQGDVLLLRLLVQTALAGLLYYVGLQLRSLGNAIEWGNVETVKVCLGGRGSLLFQNVLADRPETLRKTVSILAAAAQRPFDVQTVFTGHPKHEVAYGLVVDRLIDDSNRHRTSILGESFVADGAQIGPTEPVTRLISAKAMSFDRKLPSTRDFVEMLKKEVGVIAELDAMRDDLISNCGAAITDNQMPASLQAAAVTAVAGGSDTDTTPIEPPFAIVLREMIGLVNRPRAKPLLRPA